MQGFYNLPAAGQDVPDDFHAWAESVSLAYESGRDGDLIYCTTPYGDWICAPSGGVIFKVGEGQFSHMELPAGMRLALMPVDSPDLADDKEALAETLFACARYERPSTGWVSALNAFCDRLLAKPAQQLGELLARIHGDGGQYEAQHGTEKALADADKLVARWRALAAGDDADTWLAGDTISIPANFGETDK